MSSQPKNNENRINREAPGYTAPRAARPIKKSDVGSLKSQTPVNRQLRRNSASAEPGTSPRTSEPNKFRIKQIDEEKEKEIRQKKRSYVRGRIMLVAICYLILMPISLLLVYMWLPKHKTPETQNYVYQVGEDGNYISRKIYSWDVVRTDGVYYLDMTGIADLCGLITTGDSERMRYIDRTSREGIEFYLGSSLVCVNGTMQRMGDDSYLRNGKVYVPLDFVNRCINGVHAELDTEKNKITVVREKDASGNYVGVSFKYRSNESVSGIQFQTIDPEIQNEIIRREELNRQEEQARQELQEQGQTPAEPEE